MLAFPNLRRLTNGTALTIHVCVCRDIGTLLYLTRTSRFQAKFALQYRGRKSRPSTHLDGGHAVASLGKSPGRHMPEDGPLLEVGT